MEKQLRNILQEKFEGFEPDPGPELWTAIESQVQSKPVISIWSYLAVAASVGFLFLFFWLAFSSGQPEQTLVAAEPDPATEDIALPPTDQVQVQEVQVPAPAAATEPIQTYVAALDPAPDPKVETSAKTFVLESSAQTAMPALTPRSIKPLHTAAETMALTIPAAEPVASLDTQYENPPSPLFRMPRLKVKDALAFAATGLNELVHSPVDFEKTEQTEEKTGSFHLQLGTLSISRNSHSK